MGIPEEDFRKPKIAVVNSSSTLSVCYIHLDRVSQAVQEAPVGSGKALARRRGASRSSPTGSPP